MDINSAIIALYEMQSLEQMLTYLAQSKPFVPTVVPLQQQPAQDQPAQEQPLTQQIPSPQPPQL